MIDAAPPPELGKGLTRMRAVAGGLLALSALVFAFTLWGQERWPWLAPLRAFAEAALVGGIADWFAVTALFRHPLGIPVPHTAVIPRNHGRIAGAIGRFVAGNLLASQAMAQRLEELDTAGRLGRWLATPATTTAIAARIAGSLPPVIHTIGEQKWRDAIGGGLHKVVDLVITASRMGGALSYLVGHGYHHTVFNFLAGEGKDFIAGNRPFIRAKVASECPEWLPLWVEERISEGLARGIETALAELQAPDHPWKARFELFLQETIDKLATSEDFAQRIDDIKARILDDADVDAYLRRIGADAYAGLSGGGGAIEKMVRQGLADFADRLEHDPGLRAAMNRWLRDAAEALLVPRRDFIGSLITDLIMRWRTDVLTARLEAHVGKDLQYIRINGTVVGGLVGLLIYAATTLAGR
ncbi:MAG TPA: DUF445 domain-containing protein [Rhodospirillaceae bacterium]|nr:DUF445 domain-containing protein [Rhodospirillaceae bacterium]